ncbi:hypothetical protein SLEP1_g5093 [Rubroshorea leprosula]|uniref:Uncharacterized protein n=1 Tax=Rubroshorea leprosula TaxID=152421 RepID=A0AAV5HR73_9ROSI|nr:hypothetical protein SLEP1_g5093 [Rubroshorea leprosula]
MATDPFAFGFLPILASADGMDGKFDVKGASRHVERDLVIPSILKGSFGFFFERWKGCSPFRLGKGFSSSVSHACTAFQCLLFDMCVYKAQFACGLRFLLHPFILKICDGFSISLPQLAPHAIVDLFRMRERSKDLLNLCEFCFGELGLLQSCRQAHQDVAVEAYVDPKLEKVYD